MSDLNRDEERAKRRSGPTELYRHFDAKGVLLYVGISLSTANRLGQHRCVSPWSKRVTSITIERYPNRKAALDAERNAIQSEGPLYNVTGKKKGFRITQPSQTVHLTASDPDPRETPLERYFRLHRPKAHAAKAVA